MCCKIISPELLALLYAVCIPDILLSLYFTQLWAELAGSSGHSTDLLVMAALWYRAGHYYFALWFLSIFVGLYLRN